MTLRSDPWPAGVPCWADLMVPDVEASKAFYGKVFPWTFEHTGEEFGGYVMAHAHGAPAAGIGPMPPDAHTAWTLYIASDDVDATAKLVADHGGTVVVEPGDVGPMGRMFLASDPAGALFGVWQALDMIGAGVTNEPGGISWEDLRSTAPDDAKAFYKLVFNYGFDALDAAGPDYSTFARDGEDAPLGGMGGLMGDDGPSHWLVYFGVASVDDAAAAATAAGGTVTAEPFDTPYGRMAGLVDPDGAGFWVVENQPGD
jgi:predicted enzyme related to lactoylglutathione lyase